jgi:hypothetical protein
MYKSIDPEGLLPTAMAIEAIYKSLEHFKKQIK